MLRELELCMFQFWHDFGWRLHRWLVRLCYPRTDGLIMLSRVAILLWTLSLASWVKKSGSSSSWVFNPDFSWVIQMSGLRRLNRILWSAGWYACLTYSTRRLLLSAWSYVLHAARCDTEGLSLVMQRRLYDSALNICSLFFFEKIMLSISTPLN